MAADEAKQRATRKTNAVDSTGQTVADNIARLRAARGLSTYKLAERLANDARRPIAASAITRIEAGERKVDVDDLMAFAVALRVSPTALLLEPTVAGYFEVTGAGVVQADVAWGWLYGEHPLAEDLPETDDGAIWNDFQTMSRPAGRRQYRSSSTDDPQHKVTEEVLGRLTRNREKAAPTESRSFRQRGVGGHPRPQSVKADESEE